ncbi:MAG TPA: glycosyltransferase family 2 protein [Candidatus Nanoarchaeia archaeon]|nr:glycosyltransferase family 2 protein [Candidatus Nanoarchaeia archaeon]
MITTWIIWFMYFASLYFVSFWMLVFLEKGIKEEQKSPRRLPLVTICIPAYNEEENIKQTVQSVLNIDYPINKREILCINHCSTDRTKEVLKKFGSKIKVINLKRNPNERKGAAVNAGLKVAKGELFICLDADSYVTPSALKKMLPYFEEADVASVLPLMKLKEKNTFMRKMQNIEYLVNFFIKKIVGIVDCVHVTPGPFGAYKTEVLRTVGGFDATNLTEDLEMALRLQKENYKIVQLLDAEVFTTAPKNYKEFYQQRNRWYQGSTINLIKYRKMLFNAKYGELGFFHMPMIAVSACLSIFFAVFVVYNHMIRPLFERLYDASYINFNIPFMIRKKAELFSILDLNYTFLFLLVTLMLAGVMWIVLAQRYTKERWSIKRAAFIPIYLVVYPFLMSLVWVGVVVNLTRRKNVQWHRAK